MGIPEDYIVPWVRSTAPYSDSHMDYAWSHPEILRLMSNEYLIEPSELVTNAIVQAAKSGNLYPGSGEQLRTKLAEKAGLRANQVLLGNGSTDIINIVIQTFISPGEEAIIPVPTFSMYAARLRVNGGVPVEIPISPAPDFYWNIEKMLSLINEKTKLVFICTPNNPTGNQIKLVDLIRILETGLPTFIDEAYYELENYPKSVIDLLEDYPNALINRTMSKAMGLAGFRVGYLLANAEIISYMNRVRIPWNVSMISIAAALAILVDEKDQAVKRQNIIEGRNFLFKEINAISGLVAYPSEGNFILFDASSLKKSSTEIRDEILERGIFIRPMSSHQMKDGFLRVTVGTPEQNQRFIEILRQYVFQNLG